MTEEKEEIVNFHKMELDDRILKGIAKLGWLKPTKIQEKAIPLILEGKDVLIRAKTGSGKTAAFTVPLIQKIIKLKQVALEQSVAALILAPTKELCHQIHQVVSDLTRKCERSIRSVDLASKMDASAQKVLLLERPDIVISTPTRILAHIRQSNVSLKESLQLLVVDEADLIFSFGFRADLSSLLEHLPPVYQSILASATLNTDVDNLKSIILQNPVVLKLEEPDLPPQSQISHFFMWAEELEKATILLSLTKLHLLRGKNIVYVNSVDRCYKLKLFFAQFRIKCCILNSELPVKIRCFAVNQFNQGVFDMLIASDEKFLLNPGKKQKLEGKTDKESGVGRGIDFQQVSNVINFDFPLDIEAYIHRAGRTARANNSGCVLSLASVAEKPTFDRIQKHLKSMYGTEDEDVMKKFQFKLEEVEQFKYRCSDAWRAITKQIIKEARVCEVKNEIFNSDKLKSFFDDNPRDLHILRHDTTIQPTTVNPQLADVPEYIVPIALKQMVGVVTKPTKKQQHFQQRKRKTRDDPLKVAKIDFAKKRKI